MTHDSFCLAVGRSSSWEPEMCICDVIARVREDERSIAALRALQKVDTPKQELIEHINVGMP